jgi:hypothetical protein
MMVVSERVLLHTSVLVAVVVEVEVLVVLTVLVINNNNNNELCLETKHVISALLSVKLLTSRILRTRFALTAWTRYPVMQRSNNNNNNNNNSFALVKVKSKRHDGV